MYKIKSIIMLALFSGQLLAGTPHTATGRVKDYDGSTPANGTVTFNAYITSRSGEVQTQNSTGAGYSGGYWYINVGNFSTDWSVGETLRIDANNTSTGESKSITMTLTSSDPDMAPDLVFPEPGVPDIAISPTAKDYGNVSIGSGSSQTFTVSNEGTDDIIVSSTTLTGSNPGHFSITSGGGSFTLSPGSTRGVTVRFSPAALGSKTAKLSIASNDPDENPIEAWLQGVGVGEPDIDVNPSSRNYGSVYVGSGKTRSFTVSNTGNIDLNVSSTSLTGGHSGDFSIVSGGGSFTLSPGGTRKIDIRFSPSTTGSRNTTFRINSDDPDEDPKNVALSGQGIVEPDIDVNPSSKNFGSVYIGEISSFSFQVKNSGNEDLVVSSTSIIGTSHMQFAITSGGGSFTLAPGGSRNVTVQFSPVSAGAKTATLRIENNDPNEDPKDVSLSGTGAALPPPDINVVPTQISFSEITVDTSASQVLTISNESTHLDLDVESIVIIGNDSLDFQLNGITSFSLSPGGDEVIEVIFNPLSIGQKNANIQISSNDPDEDPVVIPIDGTGIPVPVPNLSINPGQYDFGAVQLDSAETKTFILSNSGSQTLIIQNIEISGIDTSQFVLLSDSASYTIPPGDQREIIVSFSPNTIGFKSVVLAITSNDPSAGVKQVLITGKCVGLPVLIVTPDSLDFGSVEAGQHSAHIFQLMNTGTDTIHFDVLKITGEDSLVFLMDVLNPPYILPDDTASFTITFTPQVIGTFNAILLCKTNDHLNPEQRIPLLGMGHVAQSGDIMLSQCYPPDGAAGVPTNISIQFKIEADPRIGINYDQLSVYINSTPVYLLGEDQHVGTVNIQKSFSYCRFSFEPLMNYAKNGEVTVQVMCEDNETIPHRLDSLYSFRTGSGATSISVSGPVDTTGSEIVHDSLGVIVTIPPNAVDDTTQIEIAVMNHLPALPDSVNGFGLGLYFGPDGLHFQETVTIQIPIPAPLDSAALDTLEGYGLYFWDSSIGQWNQLVLTGYTASYLRFEVDRFCYFTAGSLSDVVSVQKFVEIDLPTAYTLSQNYPNPFNPSTTLAYQLPKAGEIQIEVFDIQGRHIQTLISQYQDAGNYNVVWNGENSNAQQVPSGSYLIRMCCGNFVQTRKVLLLK